MTLTQDYRALLESETRLQQILDNTTATVYVKDRDGRFLLVNRHFERMLNVRAADVLGKTNAEVFPEQTAEQFSRNDRLVLARQRSIEFEETALFADGPHTFISLKFPLYDTVGRVTAVCGISTDITRRKRTEEALRDVALGLSSARGDDIFQELVRYLATTLGVEFALIGVLVDCEPAKIHTLAVYESGRIVDNLQYELPGTPCEHVVGKHYRFFPTAVQTQFPGEREWLEPLGLDSYAGYPLFDSNGEALGLIAVMDRKPLADPELTEAILKIFSVRAAAELERMSSDQALRASEEQYRSIFNASADGLALWSCEATLVDCNAAFESLFGYPREVLLQTNPRRLLQAQGYEALLSAINADAPFHTEAKAQRRDGEAIDVEIHGVPMRYRGRPHLLAIVRDISERKRAEEERTRLETQLRQAQKMEAIGHLTGGIAHDFNNILSTITGYVVLAMERAHQLGDDKLVRYLERADHSGQRARDLIQQMLTFSRGRRGEPRPLAPAPLIKEAIKLLGSTLPSSIEIHTALGGELPNVMLDPVQVEQILMNLCINARDAMAESGRIEITLRPAAGLDLVCTSCRQPVAGDYVELVVRDTGPGVAPEVVDRMFEPFFTTKEAGKGSGMGLSTVHGIVHEHGGHIVVDTAPGAGAAFRILFRALETGASAGEDMAVETGPDAGHTRRLSGHVLVVDDEESVADFMGELLESWGLEVTLKTSSLEAEAAFTGDPQRFDLLITDQVMPGMTGLALARQFMDIRPGVPVILYTGIGDTLNEQQIREQGIRALIRKPLDFGRLFAVVQEALA